MMTTLNFDISLLSFSHKEVSCRGINEKYGIDTSIKFVEKSESKIYKNFYEDKEISRNFIFISSGCVINNEFRQGEDITHFEITSVMIDVDKNFINTLITLLINNKKLDIRLDILKNSKVCSTQLVSDFIKSNTKYERFVLKKVEDSSIFDFEEYTIKIKQ